MNNTTPLTPRPRIQPSDYTVGAEVVVLLGDTWGGLKKGDRCKVVKIELAGLKQNAAEVTLADEQGYRHTFVYAESLCLASEYEPPWVAPTDMDTEYTFQVTLTPREVARAIQALVDPDEYSTWRTHSNVRHKLAYALNGARGTDRPLTGSLDQLWGCVWAGDKLWDPVTGEMRPE